jgi:hypothetical protein
MVSAGLPNVEYVCALPREVARVLDRLVASRSRRPSGLQPVLAGFLDGLPPGVQAMIGIGVVLASTGRGTVARYVRAVRASGTAVRECHRHSGLASPHVFLGAACCAFAGWRSIEVGLDITEVAVMSKFADAASLGHAMTRYSGRSLRAWEGAGGFDALLAACIGRARRAARSAPPVP